MEIIQTPNFETTIKNIKQYNNLLEIEFVELPDLTEIDLSSINILTSGGIKCTSTPFIDYITIYKTDGNTVILSNDESIYVEPPIIEPDISYEPTPEELALQLEMAKNNKIKESHILLEKYLADNPLLYTDGKHYTVTLEKQNLLTGNLLAYQLELQLGMESPELEWNATGDECVSWTFEDLSSLAIAIKYYVKPYVAHQRKIEKDEIAPCVTQEELNNVVIDYETIS